MVASSHTPSVEREAVLAVALLLFSRFCPWPLQRESLPSEEKRTIVKPQSRRFNTTTQQHTMADTAEVTVAFGMSSGG
jgi:hypothetical protein